MGKKGNEKIGAIFTTRDENSALIAKGIRTGLTYIGRDATEIPETI